MNTTIERKITSEGFSYTISCDPTLEGTTNFTLSLLPIHITVVECDTNIYQMKEANWLLKLISWIPIPIWNRLMPFKYYLNGSLLGKSKTTLFRPAFFFPIGADVYEIRGHSKNYYSMMKNDVQVALIQRETYVYHERNTYQIKFKEDCCPKPILLLLCIFIDTKFYPNQGSIFTNRWDTDYVINDLYEDRVLWKP